MTNENYATINVNDVAKVREGIRLKIRVNTHGGELPVSYGDYTDLYTAEEVTLEPMEFKMISLGISMELPEGYYAEVVPRSSTPKKWGVIQANSVGIIDHEYCGDEDIWRFPALAFRHTTIPKGTRICQFRLVRKAPWIHFEEVEFLGNQNRGGFGSTGA